MSVIEYESTSEDIEYCATVLDHQIISAKQFNYTTNTMKDVKLIKFNNTDYDYGATVYGLTLHWQTKNGALTYGQLRVSLVSITQDSNPQVLEGSYKQPIYEKYIDGYIYGTELITIPYFYDEYHNYILVEFTPTYNYSVGGEYYPTPVFLLGKVYQCNDFIQTKILEGIENDGVTKAKIEPLEEDYGNGIMFVIDDSELILLNDETYEVLSTNYGEDYVINLALATLYPVDSASESIVTGLVAEASAGDLLDVSEYCTTPSVYGDSDATYKITVEYTDVEEDDETTT